MSKTELEKVYKESILLKQLVKVNPDYGPQFAARLVELKTIINGAYSVPVFGTFHLHNNILADAVNKEGRIQLQEVLTANNVTDKKVL